MRSSPDFNRKEIVMTEQTRAGDRNQADAPGNSAASVAGLRPTDKPEQQRDADDIPLSDGTVTNGGAYMGGKSPDDASDDLVEARAPLDSRENFGGDGAQYVDPDIGSEHRPDAAQQARSNALAPGDIGYDNSAHPGVNQEA
jgi:hypothetical protein